MVNAPNQPLIESSKAFEDLLKSEKGAWTQNQSLSALDCSKSGQKLYRSRSCAGASKG